MTLSLRALLEAPVALPVDFSSDGGTVLLGSNAGGTMQLQEIDRDGGEPRALTSLDEPVTGLYVPGSRKLLVLMDEGGNERQQLYILDGGELEPLVVEPDFLHRVPYFTRDGSSLAYQCNRRNGKDFDIYTRSMASGEERCIVDRGGWWEPAGFSPDGAWYAAARMTERSGDNDLWLVHVESGEFVQVERRADDEAYFGDPRWLADGSGFFFATSDGRDTSAIARYDLAVRTWEYVVESDWDLLPHIDDAGRTLVVEANEDGYSHLELRDPATLEQTGEVPLPGRGVVASLVPARDGSALAYQFSSPLEPGDVWLFELDSGESRRLTHSPRGFDTAALVEPSLHRFPSFDGESVPTYLYEAAAGAPVLVGIHGGPEAQSRPTWNPIYQYAASRGYAVAVPNVRGSTGYGKRWEHLDDVRLRLDSVRDLASLHRWLGAEHAVLFGGSYGGYMVLAGLAFQPDLWAAGIDIVGISNLVSFLENTAEWRRTFREREYGSLEHDRDFLVEASPISRVDDLRAPLFIIHGANDPRVPLGEAEQIHAALVEKGIPCELLVYHDEGHGLQKLPNRLDAYTEALAWLDRVLAL